MWAIYAHSWLKYTLLLCLKLSQWAWLVLIEWRNRKIQLSWSVQLFWSVIPLQCHLDTVSHKMSPATKFANADQLVKINVWWIFVITYCMIHQWIFVCKFVKINFCKLPLGWYVKINHRWTFVWLQWLFFLFNESAARERERERERERFNMFHHLWTLPSPCISRATWPTKQPKNLLQQPGTPITKTPFDQGDQNGMLFLVEQE